MYAVNVKPCARGLIQFLVDPPSCVQLSFARKHNSQIKWWHSETGTIVFMPYLTRVECLTIAGVIRMSNHCRCYYKGSVFSSVIFKMLSVGSVGNSTRADHSDVRHLTYCLR